MKSNLRINAGELISVYPQVLPRLIERLRTHFPTVNTSVENARSTGGQRRNEMEGILCDLLLGQLQSLGLLLNKRIQEIDLNVTEKLHHFYDRWFDESIAVLLRNHRIRLEGGAYSLVDPAPVDLNAAWEAWERKKTAWMSDPNMHAQVVLVEATLKVLPQILTGHVRVTDVLFPDSSMDLVEGIYKNNTVSDFFNGVLAKSVIAYIQQRTQLDPLSEIRILEIGAGTGGTSAMVLKALSGFNQHVHEYSYTDLSKAFLMHAEKEYGPHNPFLRYQLYNVELPAAEQNISDDSYDLVIATNVLHATKNIRLTLRNAKAAMRANGLLLLNEISRNDTFTHLTFGLLEGWWLSEDSAIRIPGCPGLDSETWQSVLHAEGFRSVFFPVQDAIDLGQQIIIAESDGVVRKKQGSSAINTSAARVDSSQQSVQPSMQRQTIGLNPTQTTLMQGVTTDFLHEQSVNYFARLIADTLKTTSEKISPSEQLKEYGIDSILIVQLTNKLRNVFGNVSSTLFFECPTINALADYFVRTHTDVLLELLEFNQQDAISLAGGDYPLPADSTTRVNTTGLSEELLREGCTQYLKQLIAETLKTKIEKINPSEQFKEYGIDSILVVQLTNKLRKVFGTVTSTLFFEYQTIDALVAYFVATQREVLLTLLGLNVHDGHDALSATATINAAEPVFNKSDRFPSSSSRESLSADSYQSGVRDVAVIGMSARFPQANCVSEFWENIKTGKNCITEIPKDRWDWEAYFDEARGKKDRSYTKWGGFIDDVDKFDPLFFQISPAEAEEMDPQERLFLQEAYASVEDAGYTPDNISENRKVGVFVGVMNGTYSVEPSYWSIANRVSYVLDLQGPSMAVDSACSSSLTAVHLALESLYSGSSDSAIVGGVNLIMDPAHYLRLSAMTVLSAGDKCCSFGDKADGFVDGEGVGALVLKPLQQAIEDGDRVYGVLKGSMLNSGGKTNGYTVPNPNAQYKLISDALARANINARTVSYIEAHGTGTALGDPIEIAGLTRAYAQHSNDKQFCAIGSVKSNIGHSESAAGIGGIIKVLMQMKHGVVAPSLHSESQNPEIDFSNTPFIVQQALAPWQRPVVKRNGTATEYPRCAGVSSFGAGGANAHVLIEEYIPNKHKQPTFAVDAGQPAIVVLSARSDVQLRQQVSQLLAAINEQGLTDVHLTSIAYTLQVGRVAMDERLAIVASSIKSLEEKCRGFLGNQTDIENVCRGQVKANQTALGALITDEDIADTITVWINKRKYSKLINLWVKGLNVEWTNLYHAHKPPRISLPTYPFAKERYWLPRSRTISQTLSQTISQTNNKNNAASTFCGDRLHPLLVRNTSDFSEQRFSSTFTGDEFFLADHIVNGKRILPGVAYLEMARAAVMYSIDAFATTLPTKNNPVRLKNVVWIKPIIVDDQAVEVHIRLSSEQRGEINYEIYSNAINQAAEPVVHHRGSAVICADAQPAYLNIKALQAQCNLNTLASAKIYDSFREMGMTYGPGQQGLDTVYLGSGQVLARISLPSVVTDTQHQFVLHPSLLDSALQATISLTMATNNGITTIPKPTLLFSLQEMTIFGDCGTTLWAHIRHHHRDGVEVADKVQKLDIDLCDDLGKICVTIKGVSSRVLPGEVKPLIVPSVVNNESLTETIILAPVWDVQPLEKGSILLDKTDGVLIVNGDSESNHVIQSCYAGSRIIDILYEDAIDTIVGKIRENGAIDHLVWLLAPLSLQSVVDDAVIQGQNQGILFGFRLVKALLGEGYGNKPLELSVITRQAQAVHKNEMANPVHASIHGFIGAVAKEYPQWKIRLMDVDAVGRLPISDIAALPADSYGNAWAYRQGQWYRQHFAKVEFPSFEQTVYRVGGVYVVVGGAGGLGEAWSEYMVRTYQAHIIWIGRKKKNNVIQDKLDALAALGPAPQYISADARDREALARAYDEIKRQHPQIHGVIHSAADALGENVVNTDQQGFHEGISVKVDISVRLAQVFAKEPLDFVLFFSSIISFVKNPKQSAYAAGSTFKDTFAQRLAQEWPCKVKTINWGYWGSVGFIASSETYQNWMMQAGIGSIEPAKAMQVLEKLLAGPLDQFALVKVTRASALGVMTPTSTISAYPGSVATTAQQLMAHAAKSGAQQASRVARIVSAENRQNNRVLEKHLVNLLWGQLQSLGLFTEVRFTAQDCIVKLPGSYGRWLEESLAIVSRAGFLGRNADHFTVLDSNVVDLNGLWRQWDRDKVLWLTDPSLTAQVILVEKTLRELPDILNGERLVTDIMFPNASMALVEGVYKHNPVADYFNEVLAETVVAYVQERCQQDASARIRILEIGAGTGGTSAAVFEKLRPYESHIQEYCYTDLSKAFLLHAQKTYGASAAYLKYGVLNIEAPIVAQGAAEGGYEVGGYDAGGYDIVIAANVMHATKNIRETLRNAKALLAHNGLLVLNELSANSLFAHLTFGLLEGWWLYQDSALRIAGCPGLTPGNWQQVLEQEGFNSVFYPAREANELGQQIIVAQSDGVVRQKNQFIGMEAGTQGDASVAAKPIAHKRVYAASNTETRRHDPMAEQKMSTPALVGGNVTDQMIEDHVRVILRESVAEALKLADAQIQDDRSFSEYGVDSIIAVNLVNTINNKCNLILQTTVLFDYNNVNLLVSYISKTHKTALTTSLEDNDAALLNTDSGLLGEIYSHDSDAENVAANNIESTLNKNNVQVESYSSSVTAQMIKDHVRTIVRESIVEALKLSDEHIQDDRSFSEYGVDSIVAVNLVNTINQKCGLILQTTVLFDYSTVNSLVNYISQEHQLVFSAVLQKKNDYLENAVENSYKYSAGNDQNVIQKIESATTAYWPGNRFQKRGTNPDEGTTLHSGKRSYQRVIIERPGNIDALKVVRSEVMVLEENEVRLSVRAFSLNFADLLCVSGMYPTMPPYPFTPGFEASGVVVEVGEAVTSVRPGDSVIAIMGASLGAQATMLTCPEHQVFRKPESLSFEHACALPAVAITMVAAFRKAQLKKGEKILIQTATGGVGLIAVQLAKYYGAEIYATAGSQHKLEYLEALGVTHNINYQDTDFEKEIQRITHGRGVDVVINTLSGDAIQKGLNCLSPKGRYIEIAMTAIKSAKTIDLSVLSNNQTFFSVDLRKTGFDDPETFSALRIEMLQLVDQGVIRPTIYKVFPFNQIMAAHQCMNTRENIGKIVVNIPNDVQYKHDAQFKHGIQLNQGIQFDQGALPRQQALSSKVDGISKNPQLDVIAIIGMSGRFAQSDNVSELWTHLSNGSDLIEEVTRWRLSDYVPEYDEDAGSGQIPFCNYGGFLNDIDTFDPYFFNISGLEANYTDPQQRLFLEESWKALEDAGYAGTAVEGHRCGVYVGFNGNDYARIIEDNPPAQAMWGNLGSIIPARIAYYLDLQGPAVAIDSACSSSLVAIHLACQGLQADEMEMALAGGVFVQSTPNFFISGSRAGMLSTTGRCYTFDDRADGFVPGEGVGVVVLKPLANAICDGDQVYGVIRGSATNQDGATNGITAPSANSQERLERYVYDKYNLSPAHFQMVEAHGTGTKLGDPIEYQALTRAFRAYTDNKHYCAIGSIKTNIGHATAAAGIAGLLKVLLSLKHKKIPPTLNYRTGNSNIQFKNSPFYVNTTLSDWKAAPNEKRRAAISSFGLSGTNAHMVIEEAPELNRQHAIKPGYLMVLSARTSDQLRLQVEQMLVYCKNETDIDCGNISFTLLLGRKHFNHRLACVVRSQKELVSLLGLWLEKGKVPQITVSALHENDVREQPSLKRYGNQCIENCRAVNPVCDYLEDLAALADLFCQGYALDYGTLFSNDRYSRLSLPSYPFSKKRYWVPGVAMPASKIDRVQGLNASPLENSINHFTGGNLLAPVWDAFVAIKNDSLSSDLDNIVVFCEAGSAQKIAQQAYPNARVLLIDGGDAIESLAEQLACDVPLKHIVWLAPAGELDSIAQDIVIESQQRGVLHLFRLVKALLQLNYGSKVLNWSVITTKVLAITKTEAINPSHASIYGLMGSMAKEYVHWKVRLVDVNSIDADTIGEVMRSSSDPQGNACIYRDGQWYRQRWIPMRLSAPEKPVYKEKGIYVVIGGAGGIGEAWSEAMIRAYNAQIIWLGRREKDTGIQTKLDKLATLGTAPYYIAADASDFVALSNAYEEIRQKFSRIDGIIHSSIVLLDKSLANMDETIFQAGLSAKVDVSVRMTQVFAQEPLDFVLFFSSFISHTKAPGQSNYAAGCTFKDAFAHQLAREWPCAVKVINWGYWGSVGIVTSQTYQDRMLQAGIDSIEVADAMAALDLLLGGPFNQVAFLKTKQPLLGQGIIHDALISVSPPNSPINIDSIKNTLTANSDALFQEVENLKGIKNSQGVKNSVALGNKRGLEKHLVNLLWGQLQSLGLFTEVRFTAQDCIVKLPGSYGRWLEESLVIVSRGGFLGRDADHFTVLDSNAVDLDGLWRQWDRDKALWLTDPSLTAQVILVEKTLRELPGILNGERLVTDIMFPNASMALVEGVYKHNPVADYFNEVLAETVVAYVQERCQQDASARIRILEIGAGTGGTSAAVFEKLRPYESHIQEYCYTDLSKEFLLHAQKRYGASAAYLKYGVLNIEAPIMAQGTVEGGYEVGGYDAGGYDIVIAANVLHATKNIRETLRNAKVLLAHNGLLLLNELSANSLFAHLTFGLLEGWWLYEDSALRIAGCPGLTPANWQRVLEQEGFNSVFYPAQVAEGLGQQIIVAQSDGVIRIKTSEVMGQEQHAPVRKIKTRETNARKIIVQKKVAVTKVVATNPATNIPSTNIPTTNIRTTNAPVTNVTNIAVPRESNLENQVKDIIIEKLSATLNVDVNEIDVADSFSDYGIDSITAGHFVQSINKALQVDLKTTTLFDYSTVTQLTLHILSRYQENLLALQHQQQTTGKHAQATLNETSGLNAKTAPLKPPSVVTRQMIEAFVKDTLIEKLSETLNVDVQDIDVEDSFSNYGIDSISAGHLVQSINLGLQVDLKTTNLFDYSSVTQLATFLLSRHNDKLITLLTYEQGNRGMAASAQVQPTDLENQQPSFTPGALRFSGTDDRTASTREYVEMSTNIARKEPIAIIGMSGRFANSETLSDLWQHLANGADLVQPVSRWELQRAYEESSEDKGRYCNYGSFLDGIDQFDPLFFNIAGVEARYMDPQQRIFLEEAWKALEDAGYAGPAIQGRQCGVYVGCGVGDYRQLFSNNPPPQAMWGNANSIIPARIAYYLNLQGPAVAIDTACSSSLVAIHLACQGLWGGETEIALAGGVSIQCTPDLYVSANRAEMLSPTGRCYTFDDRANGFVPGEGVGVIVLKRLCDALDDGDHIDGVIRGSAMNQDGASNGITAPSAISQQRLERMVYDTFNINPENIQLVEAHGTGTKLGDPIEFEALTNAFRMNTQKKEFCAIGSIKTNIGHTTAAAGIAGVLKVLLSLKHKKIPPSLHYQSGNSNIEFSDSPFFVNTILRDWDVKGQAKRCAATSSFGFSGTNVHMVIEEAPPISRQHRDAPGYLITLSAKSAIQLKKQVELLLDQLDHGPQLDCGNLSFTLLLGRKHFNHRLACIVRSQDELVALFKKWLSNAKVSQILVSSLPEHDHREQLSLKQYGNQCIQACKDVDRDDDYLEKLSVIADLYSQGYALEFAQLFPPNEFSRLSLPSYPFAKERCWVEDVTPTVYKPIISSNTVFWIHPLLQQNTSNFNEQRFSTVFSGQEFFLEDHVVNGVRVLPGVAYLEMARAAVVHTMGGIDNKSPVVRFKNVVWAKPVSVGDNEVRLHIGLLPEPDGQISYEIYSESEQTPDLPTVHSQGRVALCPVEHLVPMDILAIKQQCKNDTVLPQQCYDAFKGIGIIYGPGYQCIKELYVGNGQVLAKLSLPQQVLETAEQFVLHPSLLDSAIHSSIGLMLNTGNLAPALPFALQQVDIIKGFTPEMWSRVKYSDDVNVNVDSSDALQKLDIDLCDETGAVCVRIIGFTARTVETPVPARQLMWQPYWKAQAIVSDAQLSVYDQTQVYDQAPVYDQHLVILCEIPGNAVKQLETQLPGVHCLKLHAKQQRIDDRFQHYVALFFEEIKQRLSNKPKGRMFIQIVVPADGEQQLFAGFSGFLKTLHLENPNFTGQLIALDAMALSDQAGLAETLLANRRCPAEQHIRYEGGQRWLASWQEVAASDQAISYPWKSKGVYLITGGAGGLGLIFAKEIAQQVGAVTLILTGRSTLKENGLVVLKELETLGATVKYRQVDVTHSSAVDELVKRITCDHGCLNGIIHSAGVVRDNFIIKKTRQELHEVLAPKVSGVVNLDHASMDVDLDFFILFSAGAAMGNAGQADYASANAFLDAYAGYRNQLVYSQQRKGQTLSINWPLWQDGGMQIDSETENMMAQQLGVSAMKTPSGIQAFYKGLACGGDQVMFMEGNVERIRSMILPSTAKPVVVVVASADNSTDGFGNQGALLEKAIPYFTKLLSSVIGMPVDKIDANAPLEDYGIDSIMVMQLTNTLEKTFGTLSKTLFFEYQNIKELTAYFLESYPSQLLTLLGGDLPVDTGGVTHHQNEPSLITAPLTTLKNLTRPSRFASLRNNDQEKEAVKGFDIAIIGLSGRYPQADNVEAFWRNLRDGKDCITEIPKDRWNHRLYFDEDKNRPGKTYSKWGGFIDGVDRFDPLFFNISPREAEIMDPQERLFMLCVYEAIEDSGYTKETLSRHAENGVGGNVGVYVGVMYEEYQLYGAQETMQGRPIALSGSPSSIANRISYFCNFHGPSMAVDTMCSASLTTLHLACQSLLGGSCEVAIAGGVNVSIHPNKYLMLGQGKFASSNGRCESFGQGGDGYVPGEGVGAVLLKPKKQAVADGDNIYGIVKGTSINHGGKTNGYSVPNPIAQANVIAYALHEAGINPRAISYVEAHGTGTSLGDPVEIAGLSKAYQKYSDDKQFCAIGSAKSNIGHCESAAGIGGVTKVLMQLKYRQLAPSLHAEVLNPNIDFTNSPFVVQQQLSEWKRPVINIDGAVKEYPRMAGISSFGAGGSNAHVIIEEYIPEMQDRPTMLVTANNPAIIVLSARNHDQLMDQVNALLSAIQRQPFSNTSVLDMAYTLQVGREAMEARFAVIVHSITELERKLVAFMEGTDNVDQLYEGQVKRNKDALAVFTADEELQEAIDKWISRKKYAKLLGLWVKGLVVDWNKLYGELKPQRISLPTYPFARERYWIPDSNQHTDITSITKETVVQFDDVFYGELIEDVLNDSISIEAATLQVKNAQR